VDENQKLTRRESLLAAGGIVVAALLPEVADAASGPAGVSTGAISCLLTPEMTEGPFYVPNEKVRRNITEGKPGVPLELRLAVVNASTCKPIRNAVVDIWHADAGGVYSGAVAGNTGTNFLRGVQRTDKNGLAVFKTIYPGWYRGRATHVHVKVYLSGNVMHTGQLFFNESISNAVYKRTPYRAHGTKADTPNASDSIYRNGGSRSLLVLKRVGAGYLGGITMGVSAG
jgi:protocatechuate 3,4-dioxygenase beta subunit